jgi:serine/threonine protein kinase
VLCPHCQAPNSDEARFCGACGKATQITEPVAPSSFGEAPSLIGRVIAGRYRILSKLGEGGMGAVYQAEQISLKRTVAIKLLRPDVSASTMLLRRFNAEAEAVAKLRHPNTVNIYDFGQDTDGSLFIAMELIEGRSLRTVIHREAPLPIRRTLAIAAQVAASLADAHAKTIIHRDLKPDNVMLTDRGRSKDNVTVLDFGIAKLRDDSRATQQMTQAGDMLGTPQYMAPEQIRGEQIDGRTDVYALGGMIYEMLTARLPYEAPTVMALLSKHLLEQAPPPSQRRPDLGIPPMIDDLVMSAMAKDPAARPPTMEDYGERLAAILASLPPDPTVQRSAIVGLPGTGALSHVDTPAAYSADSSGFAPLTAPPPGPSTRHPPTTPPGYPPTPPPSGYPGQPSGYAPQPAAGYPAPQPSGYAPQPSGYAPQPAAGYAGPPYAGPPYAGPPPGPPYAPHPAPSGGGSKLMWVLVAVLLLGAGGTGIYFATRGPSEKTVADAHEPDPDEPDPDKPDPDKPDPDKPEPDKWDRKHDAGADPDDDPADPPDDSDDPADPDDPTTAHGPALAGKTVDIAQGVKIIAPPGMAVKRQADGVVIGDLRSFAIVAGPITEKSNDPDVLVRSYAKSVGLQIIETKTEQVAGARRKVYMLGGLVNGAAVVQTGVPLLGPGYRVAVIVHLVATSAQVDPSRLMMFDEVLTRRIIVPAATP